MTPDDLSCRQVADLLTASMEGVLTPGLCEAVERHLAACVACGISLDQMRITVELLERLCGAAADRSPRGP